MHPLRTATALVAALALVVLPACGDDDEDTTTSVAPTTAAAPATSAELETSAEVATSAEDTALEETAEAGTDTALEATTDGVPSGTEDSTDTAMADTAAGDTAAESPDEADVRAAIQAYLDAFLAQDGAAACDLLTPTIQDAFLEAVQATLPDADTCEEAFTAAAGQAGDAGAVIGAAEIGPITVEGDTATSSLQALGQEVPINLERIDGEWKIANLPGQ